MEARDREKAAALFTGRKESVYSLLEARELGYNIKKLLLLDKPGFSVHKANLSAVRAVARMLGYDLTVIKTNDKLEDYENLIAYLRRIREEGIDGLLTGNVNLEERYKIHEKICEKAGLKPIEPLRGLDTLELIVEYSKMNLHFTIIGIRDEELDAGWLGTTISGQYIEDFIAYALLRGIDPCGEYGEYPSLVIGLSGLCIRSKCAPKNHKEEKWDEVYKASNLKLTNSKLKNEARFSERFSSKRFIIAINFDI